MLKNYFKIAIAVLRRRKFFTFISLFGISFTLTILMVLTAFVDKIFGDNSLDKKRDRSLYISTLLETNPVKESMSSGKMGFYFLDHYAGSMKTPEKVAISSIFSSTKTYVNDKKINIDYKYTNADYWDVLDYTFLEGRPYSKQEIDNGAHVAVISLDMKNAYFGDVPSVLGKYIEADNISYRVIGVVNNLPVTTYMMYADLYLPYTVSKADFRNKSYLGDYTAILLAPSAAEVPRMRKEFAGIVGRLPMETGFTHIYTSAESYIAAYVDDNNEKVTGVTIVVTAISIFVLLLMLLPTLNLVNINITRIMERSSEIGIRKAFGASSKTLVYQFIVENIILTLLGGLGGVFLSLIAMLIFNRLNLIANFSLSMNFTVLFYGFLACLLFGLVSGVYPAWRMSRLDVVDALKA